MTIMSADLGDKSSWFGRDLGDSGWHDVDIEQSQAFADQRSIHVDDWRCRSRAFWRTDRTQAQVEEHFGCEIMTPHQHDHSARRSVTQEKR
jgi:hypothetical protein